MQVYVVEAWTHRLQSTLRSLFILANPDLLLISHLTAQDTSEPRCSVTTAATETVRSCAALGNASSEWGRVNSFLLWREASYLKNMGDLISFI